MSHRSPLRRSRRLHESRRDAALFIAFALLGAGLYARATVPCGEFDSTSYEITSVKKDGAALALPAMRTGSIGNSFGSASVYDPDLGAFRDVTLQRQP